MDISYLLWLQGLRLSLPGFVEQLFVFISAIAASNALVVLPCLLYWCLDKRAGQFLVFTFSLGTFLNQLIKNAVCAYRPWVRSELVKPAEGALAEATGYSFPSGHTQAAGTLVGATGWYYRKRWRLLFVLSWVFVLLVAFSRNFLGVHTPQDVAVGLLESVVLIAFASWLLTWVDAGANRDLLVLAVGMVALGAFIDFVAFKPYPLDYDAAGALLVNPLDMQLDCFKSAGVFGGAVLGWAMERHLLGFDVPARMGWRRLLVRFAVGMAVVGVLHVAARPLLLLGIDVRWYELIKNFLTIFAAAFVAPAAFVAVERRLTLGGRQAKAAD